jgi:hypothetical protein
MQNRTGVIARKRLLARKKRICANHISDLLHAAALLLTFTVPALRPALICYLAARLQLNKGARQSLADALTNTIAGGRATDPASSADMIQWLTRPRENHRR